MPNNSLVNAAKGLAGTLSDSFSSLTGRLGSLTLVPESAKSWWATTTLPSTVANGLSTVKDEALSKLGNALSAAVPDAIENAAKAHPATAGFIGGAVVATSVAYRKEIKEGVQTGVANVISTASSAKKAGIELVERGQKYVADKKAQYAKKGAAPVPAEASDTKQKPAVTTEDVDVSPAKVVAPKAPAPAVAPRTWSSYLPGFLTTSPKAQTAAAPSPAAPRKAAAPGSSKAPQADTALDAAKQQQRKTGTGKRAKVGG